MQYDYDFFDSTFLRLCNKFIICFESEAQSVSNFLSSDKYILRITKGKRIAKIIMIWCEEELINLDVKRNW